MKNKKAGKKRKMTLLEIMIVIFIIGIIGSVVGYNMKGSLDKAKAFKTTQGMKKISEIFDLEIAEGSSIEEILAAPHKALAASGLVNNVKDLLKDGWGKAYEFKVSRSGEIQISSKAYEKYLVKTKKKNADLSLDEEEV